MTQLWISILLLHIETGRFRAKSTHEMECVICNSSEVENELHFLCVCTTHSNYTEKTYSIVNNDNILNMSNEEKFGFLFKFNEKIFLYLLWESMGKMNRNIV